LAAWREENGIRSNFKANKKFANFLVVKRKYGPADFLIVLLDQVVDVVIAKVVLLRLLLLHLLAALVLRARCNNQEML
jgi:hypothetical protein